MQIIYINRQSGKPEKEEVYGGKALAFLNGPFGGFINFLLCRFALFSMIFGYLQKTPGSKKKIRPFIERFHIDTTEFVDSVASFASFNDFFIRKIKPRPLAPGIIIPADGRYLVYPDVTSVDGFVVKGKKFCLKNLIRDDALFEIFHGGSMVIARLCPVDYHRYHFPCDGVAGPTTLINGSLFSVNPIALYKNLNIFVENKRTKCLIDAPGIGRVLYMEVGATNVGSIHQTYTPNQLVKKGEEKGYFSFGGSTLVLLFEKGRVHFDIDLVAASQKHTEVLCKMGQSLGSATYSEI